MGTVLSQADMPSGAGIPRGQLPCSFGCCCLPERDGCVWEPSVLSSGWKAHLEPQNKVPLTTQPCAAHTPRGTLLSQAELLLRTKHHCIAIAFIMPPEVKAHLPMFTYFYNKCTDYCDCSGNSCGDGAAMNRVCSCRTDQLARRNPPALCSKMRSVSAWLALPACWAAAALASAGMEDFHFKLFTFSS